MGDFAENSTKLIPPHLKRFVVEQDYSQYNEIDQAVWRFVLLQTYSRLCKTAHPAYRNGLAQTGISVEHIPRISDMNRSLAPFGWGAVCVDGFIPPRAFQEFQAAGLLPIAADIRTKDHLVYTPAPDIIHEAAGHAPILPNPEYAAYLRRIGSIGAKAFSVPEDARVYDAIFTLSEVKELPDATQEQIRAAEARLERAVAQAVHVSEATRLSRLYWWTAEYGLVGEVTDYKLYGAGLLSSLWESHSCHDPSVKKIPLSIACMDVSYDITQPQPQLFVAKDFAQLDSVLGQALETLSSTLGGVRALAEAERAHEICTVELDSGAEVVGILQSFEQRSVPEVIWFEGPVGLFHRGNMLRGLAEPAERTSYVLPVGHLVDGSALHELSVAELERYRHGSRFILRWASGVTLTGEWVRGEAGIGNRVLSISLKDARLEIGNRVWTPPQGNYDLLPGATVRTAYAGASNPSFYPETEFSKGSVPKPRTFLERDKALLALYEQSAAGFRKRFGAGAHDVFETVHRKLVEQYPEEWLLRWNLLESLLKLGERSPLTSQLVDELENLEIRFAHREPIESGLRYLRALAA